MRGSVAVGAAGDCAPTAPAGRFWSVPRTHPSNGLRVVYDPASCAVSFGCVFSTQSDGGAS